MEEVIIFYSKSNGAHKPLFKFMADNIDALNKCFIIKNVCVNLSKNYNLKGRYGITRVPTMVAKKSKISGTTDIMKYFTDAMHRTKFKSAYINSSDQLVEMLAKESIGSYGKDEEIEDDPETKMKEKVQRFAERRDKKIAEYTKNIPKKGRTKQPKYNNDDSFLKKGNLDHNIAIDDNNDDMILEEYYANAKNGRDF
jgi:hypothetical protein